MSLSALSRAYGSSGRGLQEDTTTTPPKPLQNSDPEKKIAVLEDAAGVVDIEASEPLPNPTPPEWNRPRINAFRVAAAFWGFMINGMHDACFGPLIPYFEAYYNIQNYTIVFLVFFSPFLGYVTAALVNNRMSLRFGRRGAATIAPFARLITYVVIAAHPPFPVIIAILILAGFGSGYQDASWNAWIGTMKNATHLLSFLHGFYGLGALLAPLIATSMIVKGGLMWYTFFYVMIGAQVFELLTAAPAFWRETGTVLRHETTPGNGDQSQGHGHSGMLREAVFKKPAARATWLCALFLLGYVGIEVALGGWITTFMLQVRNADPFSSGMAAMGFWLGLTVGRFTLGFLTHWLGVRRAVSLYLPLTIGFQLLFWLVPRFYVSTVAVALEGCFLGPIFPAAVVALSRLLPSRLHISGIGFAATVGKSGGSIFPFAVGAIAHVKGVEVLQPIILALEGAILLLWFCLPRIPKLPH